MSALTASQNTRDFIHLIILKLHTVNNMCGRMCSLQILTLGPRSRVNTSLFLHTVKIIFRTWFHAQDCWQNMGYKVGCKKTERNFSTEVMIQAQRASGGQTCCFLHSDIICVEFTVLCKQSCMYMTIIFMHTEVLFLIVQLHSFNKATPALATPTLKATLCLQHLSTKIVETWKQSIDKWLR